MPYAGTFKINGIDFSQYVHKNGPQYTLTPKYGLPDRDTLDGVTHVDYAKHKGTLIVPFNPATPEQARAISSVCKSGVLFVTFYDQDSDADVTIRVKPVQIDRAPALTKRGAVSHYRVSLSAFQEL
jgi:hypothetical protein